MTESLLDDGQVGFLLCTCMAWFMRYLSRLLSENPLCLRNPKSSPNRSASGRSESDKPTMASMLAGVSFGGAWSVHLFRRDGSEHKVLTQEVNHGYAVHLLGNLLVVSTVIHTKVINKDDGTLG